MTRRRFTEREVIETLIRQGAEIRCYRSKQIITLETVGQMEREHLLEHAMGGDDAPANSAYTLKAEHARITNGTKATTAGSSKQRIAKVKRLVREQRGEPKRARDKFKKPWAKGRKLQSKPFRPRMTMQGASGATVASDTAQPNAKTPADRQPDERKVNDRALLMSRAEVAAKGGA